MYLDRMSNGIGNAVGIVQSLGKVAPFHLLHRVPVSLEPRLLAFFFFFLQYLTIKTYPGVTIKDFPLGLAFCSVYQYRLGK